MYCVTAVIVLCLMPAVEGVQTTKAVGSTTKNKPAAQREQRQTIANSIGMKLVKIPAGEFVMGNHDTPADLAKAFPDIEKRRIDELIDEITIDAVELPPGERALISLQLPAEFVIVFDPVTHTAQ